jgi:hypothetical protein
MIHWETNDSFSLSDVELIDKKMEKLKEIAPRGHSIDPIISNFSVRH